jgi:hypothetical protein
MRLIKNAIALVAAACSLLGVHTSEAQVTLTFAQVGPDVTATWSGSYLLPTGGTTSPFTEFTHLGPQIALGSGGGTAAIVGGAGIQTPTSLVATDGFTYTGEIFGYDATTLFFPAGAAGTYSPSGTMTFANTTLAALGASDFNNTLAFTGTGNTGGDREIRLHTATIALPTLTSVSPNTGSTAGGTAVTLTGTNFTGATNVTFGGTAATNRVVVNSTTITCTTPARTAGAKSVLVTTPGGTNAANTLFTYVAPSGMLVFNFVESGGTVTMTYSGTLDTNGMTPQPDPPNQHNGTFIFDIPERDIIGIAGTNSNTNSYLWTTHPLNFIVRPAGQGFVFFTPNPGSTPFMNSARNAAGVSLGGVNK